MDTTMIDGNGVSLIIGASCAGIVTVGTFVMQVVTWLDTRKLKKLSLARDQTIAAQGAQLKTVKDLVNGQSEVVKAYVAKEAYEKGREHERIAPGTPSPVLAVSPVNAVATAVMAPPIPKEE